MPDNYEKLENNYHILELLNEKWPRNGDRLFLPGGDAWLAQDPRERRYRLAKGYKRSGDVLIQRTVNDLSDRHNLVYPIIFCYRHYIELALKAMIVDYGPWKGINSTRMGHDLIFLWNQFKKIAEIYGGHNPTDMAAVESYIVEFNEFDPGSFSLRYATNTQDKLIVFPISSINLINLYEVMNGVENFFECADLHFNSTMDLENDLLVAGIYT
ncbi:MAG: hypothetical protein ABL951_10225 [Alphaproteobacteria bacterium]